MKLIKSLGPFYLYSGYNGLTIDGVQSDHAIFLGNGKNATLMGEMRAETSDKILNALFATSPTGKEVIDDIKQSKKDNGH